MKKRQRREPEAAFPFLALLPEMRGEVRRWLDARDHAALARVCRALHAETPVLALPQEWRFIWTMMRQHCLRTVRSSVAHALRELVAFGVPQWPGALRGTVVQIIKPPGKQRLPYSATYLKWYWQRDETDGAFVSLLWAIASRTWALDGHDWRSDAPTQINGMSTARLADVPPDAVATWRALVTEPGRRYTPERWQEPRITDYWYIDGAAAPPPPQ